MFSINLVLCVREWREILIKRFEENPYEYQYARETLSVRLFVCLVGCFPVVVGVERVCESGGEVVVERED